MKASVILSLAFVLWGHSVLEAREPARDLADLANLETKVAAVVERAMQPTVALVSERVGSSGSGVIISPEGLILTAAHVVQGAEEVSVNFPDGSRVPGKVLGANLSKDIAMVEIEGDGPWPFMSLGKSIPLEAGDWVVAMGHSAGYDKLRTPPVRFGRVVSKGPGYYLTTDCKLIGGDSGGPLFDLEGNIVGIHSSIGEALQNNNHAGIDGFQEDWDRLLAGEVWGRLEMNPFRNPERPVIGIGHGDRRGLRGVLVESLLPAAPAASAGIRIGDLIQSVDGAEVRNGRELEQTLAKRRAGDVVKIGVLRDDREMEFEVTLEKSENLERRARQRAVPVPDE